MTSFEMINSKALSPKERITQAIEMLSPPYKDEEQYYAALCYLSYRELDGDLDNLTLAKAVSAVGNPEPVSHPGLRVRWGISISMVEIYLNVKIGLLDKVRSRSQNIKHVFETKGYLWPACVCNYLRSQILFAQTLINEDYKGEAIYLLKSAINTWKACIATTNFFSFPYRPSEMKEDCIELQAIMFMLADLKEIEMLKFDWMTKDKIKKSWRNEMRNAMLKLNPTW